MSVQSGCGEHMAKTINVFPTDRLNMSLLLFVIEIGYLYFQSSLKKWPDFEALICVSRVRPPEDSIDL